MDGPFQSLVCLVCLLLNAPRTTPAQDSGQGRDAPVGGTVMVVSDQADLFIGNEPVGRIGSGSIVDFSRENGPWLWIPRHDGWLHSEHAVPIDEALDHLNRLIEESPTAQAFQHRGIALAYFGRYEAALADYQQAIDRGLEDAALYVNRGVAHQRAGYLRAAINDYTQAIKLDATHARAYDNRASALAALGQLQPSLADSHEAIRLDPDFAEAYNNRGVTYRLLGEFEQAIDDYNTAIELVPTYAAAYANRGFARKQLGEYEQAIVDYQEAIRLDPDAPQPHNDLAWLLATCPDETRRDAERAVELAQTACRLTGHVNGDYLDTLAAAYAAAGEFDLAVETAQQALERIADDRKSAVLARLELYQSGSAYHEQ